MKFIYKITNVNNEQDVKYEPSLVLIYEKYGGKEGIGAAINSVYNKIRDYNNVFKTKKYIIERMRVHEMVDINGTLVPVSSL